MNELVIDVSHWDGDIDLKAWKSKRKCWGVIVKVGGNEQRLGRYKDSRYEQNYNKAKAAGLHVGAYYYSVATTVADAKKDAENLAQLLSGRSFDLPVYYDVEDPRQLQIGAQRLTDVIKAFVEAINSHGYYGGVYIQGSAWLNNVHRDQLAQYANWIAWWQSAWPTRAGDIGMWQQGSMSLETGNVAYDDVSGYVDCNWCVIDYPARISKGQSGNAETGGTTASDQGGAGTVEGLMRTAYEDLGYYAPADPERGSKAGRYCAALMGEDWLAGPSTEIWWCCMWVSMILDKAKVRCDGFPSQNTDVAWRNGAKNRAVDKSQIRRGDILIFDWNFANTATDHIGFATASPKNGYVSTIEGNVGNAVKEKVRSLDTIRYVVRPRYADGGGATSTEETDVRNPTQNGKPLDVDGIGGYNTVYEWQAQMDTPLDGKVTGQDRTNHEWFEGIVSVSFEEDGSMLVSSVQQKVGAHVDGIWGRETSTKIQEWLVRNGYTVGSAGIDGRFGHDSVCALQQSLNDGKWR